MKQYEVWWAKLPEPLGTRPVLLVTRDGAYEYLSRVLAVEVTTRIRGIPQEVELGAAEGLPRRCVANLDNLHAVPRSALDRRAGKLSAARLPELKTAFGFALGWSELRDA